MQVALKRCFGEPRLEVMNFLNEVVLRYPDAVSFAPGRPTERHFDFESSLSRAATFVRHRVADGRAAARDVWNSLGQYSRTNGIIAELVARHLERDEGIRVAPDAVMLTHGCQEAMAILMLGLFEPSQDALLVSDPTYIGMTGLASILGVEVVPVQSGSQGITAKAVSAAISHARRRGKRPVAVYDIPDFNNPLGTQLPLAERRALLDLLRDERVMFIEDNPYRMFSYDGEPLPTLKALDEHGVVIYLGSFSKTVYPGLRVGYLVAEQPIMGASGRTETLASALSQVKSLTTVTTAPLVQAIVAGELLEHDGSLRTITAAKLPFYRANRDRMVACIERELGSLCDAAGRRVSWTRPAGGFFLTVDLPFAFDDACLHRCARDYGVIVCPMTFFALSPGRESQVRLSFSYVTERQIEEGVGRFAQFVRDTCSGRAR